MAAVLAGVYARWARRRRMAPAPRRRAQSRDPARHQPRLRLPPLPARRRWPPPGPGGGAGGRRHRRCDGWGSSRVWFRTHPPAARAGVQPGSDPGRGATHRRGRLVAGLLRCDATRTRGDVGVPGPSPGRRPALGAREVGRAVRRWWAGSDPTPSSSTTSHSARGSPWSAPGCPTLTWCWATRRPCPSATRSTATRRPSRGLRLDRRPAGGAAPRLRGRACCVHPAVERRLEGPVRSAPRVADAFAAPGDLVLLNYPGELHGPGAHRLLPPHVFLGSAVRAEPDDAEVSAWLAPRDDRPPSWASGASSRRVRRPRLRWPGAARARRPRRHRHRGHDPAELGDVPPHGWSASPAAGGACWTLPCRHPRRQQQRHRGPDLRRAAARAAVLDRPVRRRRRARECGRAPARPQRARPPRRSLPRPAGSSALDGGEPRSSRAVSVPTSCALLWGAQRGSAPAGSTTACAPSVRPSAPSR